MALYLHNKRGHLIPGSSITEFPPALFFLFFFAFFPALNIIFFGVNYSACALLNSMELREAAKTPYSQLPGVLDSIEQQWQTTGLGRFTNMAGPPETDISYSSVGNTLGSDKYVTVSNIFTVKPFLNVPYFKRIPGLGAPWTYTIAGSRVLEDPGYAKS